MDMHAMDMPLQETTSAALERVAAALSCSVDAFHGEVGPDHLNATAELLRLWGFLGSDTARQSLLDVAWELVTAQEATPPSPT